MERLVNDQSHTGKHFRHTNPCTEPDTDVSMRVDPTSIMWAPRGSINAIPAQKITCPKMISTRTENLMWNRRVKARPKSHTHWQIYLHLKELKSSELNFCMFPISYYCFVAIFGHWITVKLQVEWNAVGASLVLPVCQGEFDFRKHPSSFQVLQDRVDYD